MKLSHINNSLIEIGFREYLSRYCKSKDVINNRLLAAHRFTKYITGKQIYKYEHFTKAETAIWLAQMENVLSFKSHSIHYNARCIARFFDFLIYEGIVDTNPIRPFLAKLRGTIQKDVLKDIPSSNQISDLICILEDNLNSYLNWTGYTIIQLLLRTRFTLKQILEIRNSDMDFEKKRIQLRDLTEHCDSEIFDLIISYINVRDKETPNYSDYLLRGASGYYLVYELIKIDWYRYWSFLASTKINSRLIKNYRHKNLSSIFNKSDFIKRTGYSENTTKNKFYNRKCYRKHETNN